MSSRLCPFCMKMTDAETCPHCGKNTNYTGTSLHLPAGYVVHGKHPYVLGAALGQGGFGITYIALDMVTQERVAIKEYFPTYCAGRTADHAVTAYPNQEDVFQKGKARFLDEARVLQSLSDLKSIVNVLDFFGFNNSAYLVMEFLEGDSLKSHAQKHGKFPAQEFLAKLRPLMEDIDRMHHRGVVHRDIAPDNIIFLPDGQMKLIDFGAARSFVGDKSMTVVVKKGFAPIEQYMRHGSNAATDVYALAATIYYCVTGTVPPDSAERAYEGALLKDPIALGADLSLPQKIAIEQALEVQPKMRTQSVTEFIKALDYVTKPEKPKPIKEAEKPEPVKKETEEPKAEPQKKPKWIAPAIAAVLLCIVGGFLLMGREKASESPVQISAPETTVPETTIPETEPPIILSEAQKYNEAVDFFNDGEYGKAAIAFGKLGDYRDAREKSFALWEAITARGGSISAGGYCTLGLKTDGTVVAVGDSYYSQDYMSYWTDSVAISTRNGHIMGLKADGTVVTTEAHEGANRFANPKIPDYGQSDVSDWTDIVAISVGELHAVGLKADGTVVAVGDNRNDKCNVSAWTNIVAISAGEDHTVGLKADGTVVATGSGRRDVSDWTDIVAISTRDNHTVGLKADGTVVAVGPNSNGKCNVSDWTDIVAIDTGKEYTVGLKTDGTVVATGDKCDVSDWTDIVAISSGDYHTVGLKADGTAVAAGSNLIGEGNVSDWENIRLPADRDTLLAAIDLDYITEE